MSGEPEASGLFGDRWEKALATAGGAIAVAAVAAENQGAILAGLGLMLSGFGAWANRPVGSGIDHRRGVIKTAFLWKPSAPGVILSLGGATLFVVGIYRIAVS